jgi:hypothetical protein
MDLLESANLNHWRLPLSKGPNRVGIPPHLRMETDPVSKTLLQILHFWTLSIILSLSKASPCLFFKPRFGDWILSLYQVRPAQLGSIDKASALFSSFQNTGRWTNSENPAFLNITPCLLPQNSHCDTQVDLPFFCYPLELTSTYSRVKNAGAITSLHISLDDMMLN